MIVESLQMKLEYANAHDPLAITASLQETLRVYNGVIHVPRDISQFCRYFLIYGSLLVSKESKGYKVQGVSNSERYTGNTNNPGGEKAPLALFNIMKDLYLSTTRSPTIPKIHKFKVKWRSNVPMTTWKNIVKLMVSRQAYKLMQN